MSHHCEKTKVDPWEKPLALIHQISTPYCNVSVSNSHANSHIDQQILPWGRLNQIETNSSPQILLHLFSQTTVFVCPDKFLCFWTSSAAKLQAEKLQKVEISSRENQCNVSPALQLQGPIAFLIETESPAFRSGAREQGVLRVLQHPLFFLWATVNCCE